MEGACTVLQYLVHGRENAPEKVLVFPPVYSGSRPVYNHLDHH